MQDLYEVVVLIARALDMSLDDVVMSKITEYFRDGVKGLRRKHLQAQNERQNHLGTRGGCG